ncbi:hypothetical protein M7I_2649 [Glarea lozoyensis 74030]|uniref:Uncharacterized protein n=1 Tax=Glarea lozoyensis (strain ATCC 74030 / MF5533) TaxID=1104152 RepID=H0EJC4_GLAL7|nr:hypothetical protein M7I_2649 [Glarea lozoyensis 74030]
MLHQYTTTLHDQSIQPHRQVGTQVSMPLKIPTQYPIPATQAQRKMLHQILQPIDGTNKN